LFHATKGDGFSVLAHFEPELMVTSQHVIGVKRFGEIRMANSTTAGYVADNRAALQVPAKVRSLRKKLESSCPWVAVSTAPGASMDRLPVTMPLVIMPLMTIIRQRTCGGLATAGPAMATGMNSLASHNVIGEKKARISKVPFQHSAKRVLSGQPHCDR